MPACTQFVDNNQIPAVCVAMKLKHLIAELEGVKTWEKPKVALEQYPTSPEIAAHMLLNALEEGDIEDAAVADLGCGGGILGIGAAILGASHVVAIDLDPDALRVAAENVAEYEVPVDLMHGDLQTLATRSSASGAGLFDCVITNPPFGTQKDSNGVDMVFLRAGLQMCTADGAVYSLHKTSTRAFIQKKTAEWGAEARVVAQLRWSIPKMYKHHKHASKDVDVDFWRCTPPARTPTTDAEASDAAEGVERLQVARG